MDELIYSNIYYASDIQRIDVGFMSIYTLRTTLRTLSTR